MILKVHDTLYGQPYKLLNINVISPWKKVSGGLKFINFLGGGVTPKSLVCQGYEQGAVACF